ncbi:glutathione-S-conjugate glycine hydrolase [Marchantia polymorpha subsp. ruderalis]|uniref:glutathione gamma-glutamylcysteinyltransferase n=2 Tax=Marchantia polymorpha TaxID=3197 RepID=A0A176VFF5_MARPO|nr:hypothetical protein AXG93_2062s1230 [Marchantia polymorpha subsp. ruderalis]PTQ39205.1 hypothetical protein MARPO_0046s0028 [Marchantia polymorpha]BBN15801.1 hypothetical protein Mp_7g00960 [Marchantia polymorpha subsp. ruderalis]|eukprot:PTQ39205.1 hypothetical protein MARPO_0046s0028 [Marchantia polymorpha]
MAVAGLYRRSLPSPPAIEFASPQGKEIFHEALKDGTMEGFFHLIAHFQTQAEPAFCALASLSVVLNALSIDPGRPWKGPWRWFDESMLECCESLEKVKSEGMTFAKVACAGACAGAAVHALRANASTLEKFREDLAKCCSSEREHLIVSYTRKTFKQTGSGHFSPIGGYHKGRDLALILDVARFKYPPHWVPITMLWEAINSIDPTTGNWRGYMVVTKPERPPSVLYTLSCKDEIWRSISKYLIVDVPKLLKSAEITNVQEAVSVVLGLLPGKPEKVTSFVKWIAEVKRADAAPTNGSNEADLALNAKVKVMGELRNTGLYKVVFDWASVSRIGCECSLPSISGDDLPSAVRNACCQGAAVLCGMQFQSSACCKKTSVTTSVSTRINSSGTETLVVSGNVETMEGVHNNVDVVVPTTRCCSAGSVPSDIESCLPLHPSTADLLTILLFALPSETWKSIRNAEVQKELSSAAASENLPRSLKAEVENLQEQLYLVHSWCAETGEGDSSQSGAAASASTLISGVKEQPKPVQ